MSYDNLILLITFQSWGQKIWVQNLQSHNQIRAITGYFIKWQTAERHISKMMFSWKHDHVCLCLYRQLCFRNVFPVHRWCPLLQVFIGHSESISSVMFSPDGLGVISAGEAIFLWDFLASPSSSRHIADNRLEWVITWLVSCTFLTYLVNSGHLPISSFISQN